MTWHSTVFWVHQPGPAENKTYWGLLTQEGTSLQPWGTPSPCSAASLSLSQRNDRNKCHKQSTALLENMNCTSICPLYTVFTLKLTSEAEIFPWQAGDPSRVHISSSLGGRGCTCQGNRLGKCPERMEASPAVFLHHPAWQLRTSAQILSNIRPCTVT